MLPTALRNKLTSVLLDVPKISSRNRRDELLANLPSNLVDGLNRDDSARTDWTLILSQLDRLGRLVENGERPLVIVAQCAMPYVEGTEAGRRLAEIIKELEDQYHGGEPDRHATDVREPLPRTVDARIPEAIMFGDERVSYGFIDRALAAAASVARLMVPRFVGGEWVGPPALGTAWVIAPGLLLTNHHVVAARFGIEGAATEAECSAQAAKACAWFDYRIEGGPRDEREVEELVCLDAALDYAILKLKNGTDRRQLQIAREPPLLVKGDRLNIVQHPKGGPLKYAIRSNHYVGTAGVGHEHFLRYLTDTEGGASGSPVFNDAWSVVALHHAATRVPMQQQGDRAIYVNNEGIAIHAILDALPQPVRDEVLELAGLV